MNKPVEHGTGSVLDALTEVGLADAATVILVGSGARDTMNARSDVDILVLHDGSHRIHLKSPGDVHVQQDNRSNFMKRLEDGDDYPGWALRFGIPIRDPDGWWAKQAKAELDNPHWPDWRAKVRYARKRMTMALELLEVGDTDAASEELMFAASHVARAVLLQHGVFPLSRPELPSQLEAIDPDIARLLDRLIYAEVDAACLRAGGSLLERRIESWNLNLDCVHKNDRKSFLKALGRREDPSGDAAFQRRTKSQNL